MSFKFICLYLSLRRYLWTGRVEKQLSLVFESWEQFGLFLEILFFGLLERLFVSLLTRLFVSFERLPRLFKLLALELISELVGGSFTFFLELNFHKIYARLLSGLSSLSLFEQRSKVFLNQGTSGDTLYHFKRKKSWKS